MWFLWHVHHVLVPPVMRFNDSENREQYVQFEIEFVMFMLVKLALFMSEQNYIC